MLIPIDAIRENGNLRHVKASAEQDAALTASIQAQGVLQPVLVRPDGGGYVLVAGHRRLRCARAAGLAEIPAEVGQMTEGWALAAQAAENMVRVPMHPVDQWRAVRDLVAGGFTFQNAASALGLDDRQTRRMERLGMLDPKLLAQIEAGGAMPIDTHLRVIASAPRAMQAKALKAKDAFQEWNGMKHVRWDNIAQACRVTRYARGHALFDPAAIKWDVDFFAQPGADDEYTTTDGETFLLLQATALEFQVEAAQAKKQRIQLVAFDERNAAPKLPAGFRRVYNADVEKPKRAECVFVALDATGAVKRIVAEDAKAVKAAAARKPAKTADAGPARADAAPDGDEGEDSADPPAAVAEKPGLTKAGLAMVHAAKTETLRAVLRTGLSETPAERLLMLLVLAWGAENVSVSSAEAYDYSRRNFRDLIARILLPGGGLGAVSLADARGFAGEIMARVLAFGAAGSGDAAEWIGAAIDAGQALPRFDSVAFLAQLGGDELRRAATASGAKATGSVKALRERLAGKMPDWRPDAAAFGAAAPGLDTDREDAT